MGQSHSSLEIRRVTRQETAFILKFTRYTRRDFISFFEGEGDTRGKSGQNLTPSLLRIDLDSLFFQ